MPQLALSDRDNGERVTAKPGQQISLTLPENPSTGYRWSLDLPDGVEVQNSSFAASGTMPGSGGQHFWVLRVLKSGEMPIRAKLWREWSGETSVLRRFELTLSVPADRG